jgi:hypothetical protein
MPEMKQIVFLPSTKETLPEYERLMKALVKVPEYEKYLEAVRKTDPGLKGGWVDFKGPMTNPSPANP